MALSKLRWSCDIEAGVRNSEIAVRRECIFAGVKMWPQLVCCASPLSVCLVFQDGQCEMVMSGAQCQTEI